MKSRMTRRQDVNISHLSLFFIIYIKEKKSGRYIRRERYAGSCQRSFYVGDDVTEEDIKGEFKHGILKLFVPKKEAKPVSNDPKYITIE